MKNRYVLSAVTLALLGVSTDQNICSVSAVATKSQAQVKAKASATLKALSTAESTAKAGSKADAKAEVEDYFFQPFQQVLAQSNAGEEVSQESVVQDKMATEGIDLGGIKSKIEEVAKPVTDQIDEKDKQALKDQAAAAAGEASKKGPGEVVKQAANIVNSPEVHIIAKAAGGKEGEEKLKQVQDGVKQVQNTLSNIGKGAFLKMSQEQFPSFDQINQMQNGPQEQNEQANGGDQMHDMPIVSQIQALDQFGNVIATAQNPKMDQFMRAQAQQPQNHQQQMPPNFQPPSMQQPRFQQPHQQPQENQNNKQFRQPPFQQAPGQFMTMQNSFQGPPQQPQQPPQQMQGAPQQQLQKPPQPQNQQMPQNNQGQQQAQGQPQQQQQPPQVQPLPQQQPTLQQQQQVQPQQQAPPQQQQFQQPPMNPPQAQPQNRLPAAQQAFDQAANMLQTPPPQQHLVQQSHKDEKKEIQPPVAAATQQAQAQAEEKKQESQKKQQQEQQQQQMPIGAPTPQSQSPFGMNEQAQQQQMQQAQQAWQFQQQMAHMYQPQMMQGPPMPPQMGFQQPMPQPMNPMMNPNMNGMFLQNAQQPMQQSNPFMFQMPSPIMGSYGAPLMMAQKEAKQPVDTQLVQHNQDVHTGGLPKEILDLEKKQQSSQNTQQQAQSLSQSQHETGYHQHQVSKGSGRPHDYTNLQTHDFVQTPYGMMWQQSPYQQFYPQQFNPYMMNFGAYSQPRMYQSPGAMPFNAFLGQQNGMQQFRGYPNQMQGNNVNPMQGQQTQGKNSGAQTPTQMPMTPPNQNNLMHSQWGNMQMPMVPPGMMQPYPYPPQQMMGMPPQAQQWQASGAMQNQQLKALNDKNQKSQSEQQKDEAKQEKTNDQQPQQNQGQQENLNNQQSADKSTRQVSREDQQQKKDGQMNQPQQQQQPPQH